MERKKRICAACWALILTLSAGSVHAADREVIQELWDGRLYSKAFEMLEPVLTDSGAASGDVTLLGIAYEEGLGVEQSSETAAALYRRAASGGSDEAAYRLGRIYENGSGVTANTAAAFGWYEKGAGSHPGAAFKYASALLANPTLRGSSTNYEPIERLVFAAEHHNTDAALLLGSLYQDGIGVEADEDQAQKWLEAASDSSPEANRRLGILFSHTDKSRAIPYFKKAVDGGDAIAAAYLGYYADQAARTDDQRKIALDYYRKGEKANIEWATKGLVRLEEHFRSIELLGMKMYGARKMDIRFQLDKIGLPLRAESPGFWDAYDSQEVLPGSRSLTIAYAPGPDQIVAELAYRFEPEGMRKAKLNFAKLRQTLSAKYGQYENRKSGQLMGAEWRVGKTSILLKRLEDKRGLILVYRFEPYATELAEVYAQARKQAIESGDVLPEAL